VTGESIFISHTPQAGAERTRAAPDSAPSLIILAICGSDSFCKIKCKNMRPQIKNQINTDEDNYVNCM
jgi:hypothetical protein